MASTAQIPVPCPACEQPVAVPFELVSARVANGTEIYETKHDSTPMREHLAQAHPDTAVT